MVFDLVRLRTSFDFLTPKLNILKEKENTLPKILILAKNLLKLTGNIYDVDNTQFTENSFNFIDMYHQTAQLLQTPISILDTQAEKENGVNNNTSSDNKIFYNLIDNILENYKTNELTINKIINNNFTINNIINKFSHTKKFKTPFNEDIHKYNKIIKNN